MTPVWSAPDTGRPARSHRPVCAAELTSKSCSVGLLPRQSPRPAACGKSESRILLVDDNADMREYVGRLLGERYEVEAVGDGLTALASARAEQTGPGADRRDDAAARRLRLVARAAHRRQAQGRPGDHALGARRGGSSRRRPRVGSRRLLGEAVQRQGASGARVPASRSQPTRWVSACWERCPCSRDRASTR